MLKNEVVSICAVPSRNIVAFLVAVIARAYKHLAPLHLHQDRNERQRRCTDVSSVDRSTTESLRMALHGDRWKVDRQPRTSCALEPATDVQHSVIGEGQKQRHVLRSTLCMIRAVSSLLSFERDSCLAVGPITARVINAGGVN